MEEAYKILYRGGSGEITEKKSRFIADLKPVSSEEEALAFIEEIRKKYWDARHPVSYTHLHDRYIEPFRKVSERVHAHGTKIFVQLFHPGRQNLVVFPTCLLYTSSHRITRLPAAVLW